MRSMSTAARLPKSNKPSVAAGRRGRAVDQDQRWPPRRRADAHLRRCPGPPASLTSRPATPRRTSATSAFRIFRPRRRNDGDRRARLADRLRHAVAVVTMSRKRGQFRGRSAREQKTSRRRGMRRAAARGTGGLSDHIASSRPTDGGSRGSRSMAGLLACGSQSDFSAFPGTYVPVDWDEERLAAYSCGGGRGIGPLRKERTAPRSRLARLAPDRR